MARVTALVFQGVIRIEEEALQDRFGAGVRRIRRPVPRCGRALLVVDAPTLSVSPNRVVRTFFDSAVMAAHHPGAGAGRGPAADAPAAGFSLSALRPMVPAPR